MNSKEEKKVKAYLDNGRIVLPGSSVHFVFVLHDDEEKEFLRYYTTKWNCLKETLKIVY